MDVSNDRYDVSFDNYWQRDVGEIRTEVLEIWRRQGGPVEVDAEERLRQLVYVVRDPERRVVGISTGFKVFVKQLQHHFFAVRLLLVDDYRLPGLASKLLVMTRDFLQSVHDRNPGDDTIGIITVVENERLKQHRNEAVWPASGMVYIGNTPKGHHVRVYYFKGAKIFASLRSR